MEKNSLLMTSELMNDFDRSSQKADAALNTLFIWLHNICGNNPNNEHSEKAWVHVCIKTHYNEPRNDTKIIHKHLIILVITLCYQSQESFSGGGNGWMVQCSFKPPGAVFAFSSAYC